MSHRACDNDRAIRAALHPAPFANTAVRELTSPVVFGRDDASCCVNRAPDVHTHDVHVAVQMFENTKDVAVVVPAASEKL